MNAVTADERLRFLARKAVADVPANHRAGVRLPAIKNLHDATGLSIRECVPLIDWAIERPSSLTRAAKETAVAVMAQRLERSARAFARLVDHDRQAGVTSGAALLADRACHRQRTAVVRLAMARTVD